MDLSDFIAFLAFIVALYGAILSTYTAISELFRLKLSIFDLTKTYITLSKCNQSYGEYGELVHIYSKDLYTLIIPVRIINKSKNITTIHEITLNNSYKLDSSSVFEKFIPTRFNHKGDVITAYDSILFDYPLLKPLLELKPLSTFEGYLVFNNLKKTPSHFDITVSTVQKSKTFHLHFDISNDYRNK